MLQNYKDVTVDRQEALDLEATFNNDDIHCIALMILGRALFSEKLTVKESLVQLNSGELIERPPLPDLELFYQTYYTSKLKRSLRPLLSTGYCCFRIVDGVNPQFGNKPMKIPALIPRADYDLVCRRWETGHEEWLVRPLGRFGFLNDFDPDMHIFFMDFCEPDTVTGKHNSLISPTKKHSDYVSQLYGFLVEAHKQRSHPPVIYEPIPVSDQGAVSIMYQPSVSLIKAQNEAGANRAQIALQEQMTIDSIQNQLGKRSAGDHLLLDAHDVDENMKHFRPTVVDNVHFIPSGYRMPSQPQLPEPQQDLLNYDSDRKEHILALYGIPASLVLSGARNNSKTTTNMVDDNDLVSFQRTLRLYVQMCCKLATQMHLATFPEYQVGGSNLQFNLLTVPYSSPSAIHRMFETGIITAKARNQTVLALNGMSYDDEADEPEDIHRPPINGTENQITALVRSKERVQLAEAQEREANAKAILSQVEGKGSEIKGQQELIKLQIELEEVKIKGQLELLEKKLEIEKFKAAHPAPIGGSSSDKKV
jgi:hypothetical protein